MSVLSGRHGYYNTSVYNLWRNIIQCSICHEEWCFEIDDDVIDLN